MNDVCGLTHALATIILLNDDVAVASGDCQRVHFQWQPRSAVAVVPSVPAQRGRSGVLGAVCSGGRYQLIEYMMFVAQQYRLASSASSSLANRFSLLRNPLTKYNTIFRCRCISTSSASQPDFRIVTWHG